MPHNTRIRSADYRYRGAREEVDRGCLGGEGQRCLALITEPEEVTTTRPSGAISA